MQGSVKLRACVQLFSSDRVAMVPEDRAAVRQACQLSVCCLFCEAEGAANVRSPCCLGLVLRLRGRRFQGRTKSNVAKAGDACGAAGAFNAFGGGPARPRGQVPPKPSEQNARPAAQRQPPRRSELPDTSQVALAAASKDRRRHPNSLPANWCGWARQVEHNNGHVSAAQLLQRAQGLTCGC